MFFQSIKPLGVTQSVGSQANNSLSQSPQQTSAFSKLTSKDEYSPKFGADRGDAAARQQEFIAFHRRQIAEGLNFVNDFEARLQQRAQQRPQQPQPQRGAQPVERAQAVARNAQGPVEKEVKKFPHRF